MLIGGPLCSGADLLIIGAATGDGWVLTQSGFRGRWPPHGGCPATASFHRGYRFGGHHRGACSRGYSGDVLFGPLCSDRAGSASTR